MKNILFIFFTCVFFQAEAQLANWTALNPNTFPTNVSGQIHGLTRVSQLKFHPSNASKMYAISARGGLFISTNGGNNWTVAPGCDFMPNARLASVCIDHTNDQILYLGTGDHNYYYSGSGVWKSTNGGTTFTQLGLSGRLVVDMIMDPLDNTKLVAITDAGIYKTTNAGSTWVLKTASRPFDELKQKTPTSRTLFACTTDSAFFRSTDFGDTWSQITSGIVLPPGITNGNGCRIAVTPADTNIVYLGMVANGGMLYKSTNGGTSFTSVKTTASPYLTYYDNSSSSSGQGDYNFGIGVDRINSNIVYMVAHAVWKSTDGGANWSQLTNWWQKVHTDMHQIFTSPYDNTKLYNMNDGGVWLSTDGGVNWSPKSDGMNAYEIYHGNCSPTRKDMVSIGTQDNGELYASGTGWFTNRGGDWGSQCAFDYRANSSVVYYYENNKRRSVSGSDVTYGLPSRVTSLDDIAFYRGNTNLAYVGDSFIYRTTNLTNTTPTWTQIAALGTVIKAMHVSFASPDVLYVLALDGKMYVSTNATSAAPTFTAYNLPAGASVSNRASITSIKNAPGTVYITANTKVYKTTNYGSSWIDITYNLPNVNHIRVLADEYYAASQLVFVASYNAVYYKTVNAASWTIYSTNLPSRPEAIDLSIFNDSTSNTVLRYANYGRSVWETGISNLRIVSANFAADNVNPCVGAPVQFSDLSTGNITTRTWSFPGGTPSSSTAATPTVIYNVNGSYNVTLTVSDGVTSSTQTFTAYINTNGASLPLSEGFEGTQDPPAGWKNIDNSTQGVAWSKTSLAGGYGNSSASMLFDNYSWNNPGEKDELITKRLNLTGATNAKLYFDVAYQVFSGYSDTLSVLVSTDCGATFTTVYKKGGTVLSTAGSGGNNFVPTAAQWRTDTVNLNAYIGNSSVLIAFQNMNGYGNKLYLDNINIIQVAGCTTPLLGGTITGPSTLNSGVAGSYSLSGNTGNSIQWQLSTDNGITWNAISGAVNATQLITLNGGSYQLRAAINQTGSTCPEVYSNTLVVNVIYQQGDVFSNPFVVNLPYSGSISNAAGSGFNNLYTGTNNQSSADIFYRFTTGPCTDSIKISTCGSVFDTYIHLLNASGTQLVSNDDNGPYCNTTAASLKQAVSANTTYYAVFEGYNTSTGTIQISIEEIDNPMQTNSISALGSTTLCSGQNVVLSSNQISGNSWSNGPSTQTITVTTAGTYSCTYTSPSGCISNSNSITVTVNPCSVTLNLKAYIEGYYIGSGFMQPVLLNEGIGSSTTITDDITIELHQAISPFTLAFTASSTMATDGTISCTFPAAAYGNTYYIVLKHRSGLTTWSKNPIILNATTISYNFSDAITKAFGDNLKNIEPGVFAMYSGDVNQDLSIDVFDFLAIENDIVNGNSGYLSADINGDGVVDIFDFLILEINIVNGISASTP